VQERFPCSSRMICSEPEASEEFIGCEDLVSISVRTGDRRRRFGKPSWRSGGKANGSQLFASSGMYDSALQASRSMQAGSSKLRQRRQSQKGSVGWQLGSTEAAISGDWHWTMEQSSGGKLGARHGTVTGLSQLRKRCLPVITQVRNHQR